jgi:hypothetical protein
MQGNYLALKSGAVFTNIAFRGFRALAGGHKAAGTDMTDFKAMMCILGGVFVLMCVVFYGFLFLIYPEGTSTFVPIVPMKS